MKNGFLYLAQIATENIGHRKHLLLPPKELLQKYLDLKYQRNEGIMVWAAFGINGPLCIVNVEGTLNGQKYAKMIEEIAVPIFKDKYKLGGFILQQDNAPCHVCEYSRSRFEHINLAVIPDWPPNSPDLNPIENLWAIVSAKVYEQGKLFYSKKSLFAAVSKAWEGVSLETCQNLINSIDTRLEMVISVEGGHIDY